MKIKCEYCGNYIDECDQICKGCGAVNKNYKRVANEVPTTIEELKQWYIDHNLPDENITRFFIGKDYKEPRAFGIYRDDFSGKFIVYKNKDTGERAIRYEGEDEKYAVNELYLKLKEEIMHQKSNNRRSNGDFIYNNLFGIHFSVAFILFFAMMFYHPLLPAGLFAFLSVNPGVFIFLPILSLVKNVSAKKAIELFWHVGSFIIMFILILTFGFGYPIEHSNDAYYKSDGVVYYNYGHDWYYYDSLADNWQIYDGSSEGFDRIGKEHTFDLPAGDFKNSEYYEDWSSSSNDSWGSSSSWDSGSSWDSSDSWDSGGSDWGSDW